MNTIIFFLFFVTICGILFFISRQRSKKQIKKLLNEIWGDIRFRANSIKCWNLTSGLKNVDYFITKCDVCVTSELIILLATGVTPIILTKKADCLQKNPFAKVVNNFKLIFNQTNPYVVIKFGKASITETSVELTLRTLTDMEKKELQRLYESMFD